VLRALDLTRAAAPERSSSAGQLRGPLAPLGDVSQLDRAERRALRLLALHEVALAIGAQSDPVQTHELILTQARRLLRAPAGSIYLWEEDAGLLRCTVAHNAPAGMLGGTVLPGEGAAGRAFRDSKTVLINSYKAWAGASSMGREVGVRAAVSVPLRMGQRLLGALTVHTYEGGHCFDDEDAWLLELRGVQAAMALEQARLVEEAERRAQRLLALHSVSTSISAHTDLSTTLRLVLSQATRLLQRRGGAIHLWDERSQRLVLAEGFDLPVGEMDRSVVPGEGITGQVWLRGAPVIVDDYQAWEHATARGRAIGLVALAGVPLVVAGRPLGVLFLASESGGSRFRAEEVQLLELFAGQAAVAIENARLFEAASRARAMEELDRLKSEFISAVSHELRTPLTYIQGYSELLKVRQPDPILIQDAVGEINGAAVRMARLVDDLLDLSRIEAGRLTLRARELDLGAILRSAVAAARVHEPSRQLELELPTLPILRGDPDRIRQVIDNLLGNALRYAPEGPIRVLARPDDHGVRVEVADQGPGIPPEDQPRVFEPFYRGANSEIQPLRGGGLGLTIVRKLVEGHGGAVGLNSTPGSGSTFWFTLPLLASEA
jgi:signal transduction histidine kinase